MRATSGARDELIAAEQLPPLPHLEDDALANPEVVAMLRTTMPELPDDPSAEQVEAWVDLAELVQDPGFKASIRRMAEFQAAERVDGDPGGLHHELT
ncbi:hypothetical protein [Catellatospora vulcania]|uniref:hypothetical protein n=1 Tax=Catellatospora vulcania TaxID=1460450 RepID=UPI0012D48B9F|nr:hypothetical protein [Catellatospora vulcania]